MVKRELLMLVSFKNFLQKLYLQKEMKLEPRRAFLKLVKAYEAETKEIQELFKQYSKTEDGLEQIKQFLSTEVELPLLPKGFLSDDEDLKLTPQEESFLEILTAM